MPYTTDLTTDIGKVRLLIFDLDYTKPVFPEDDMIQVFLDLEGGNVSLAAARAYETIAGNLAMVLKVMKLLDLQQNGRETAQALLEVAQRWRESDDADWSGIEFADITDNSIFSFREYLRKQLNAEG